MSNMFISETLTLNIMIACFLSPAIVEASAAFGIMAMFVLVLLGIFTDENTPVGIRQLVAMIEQKVDLINVESDDVKEIRRQWHHVEVLIRKFQVKTTRHFMWNKIQWLKRQEIKALGVAME